MKSLLKIIPVLHGTTWIYLLSNQHLRKKISIVETAGDMVYTVLSVYSNIVSTLTLEVAFWLFCLVDVWKQEMQFILHRLLAVCNQSGMYRMKRLRNTWHWSFIFSIFMWTFSSGCVLLSAPPFMHDMVRGIRCWSDFLIYTNFKIMVRRTLGARLCPPSVIHSVTGIWYKVGFLRAKSTIRLIMKVLWSLRHDKPRVVNAVWLN